jgi:hypothetical protein
VIVLSGRPGFPGRFFFVHRLNRAASRAATSS